MNERTNDANPVRILCGIAVVVAVEIILGVLLLITVVRLGRAPVDWGLGSVVGAVVLLVAALAASYAILAVASSDQPQASPGLPTLMIAAIPPLAALASIAALWRARNRSHEASRTST